MAIVYKVVDAWYESVNHIGRDCKVHYTLNHKALPTLPNSKLFAFSNLEDARNARHEWDGIIFKAEGEYPQYMEYVSYRGFIDDFWEWFFGNTMLDCGFEIMRAPQGTVICDSITLLEEVE